MLRTSNNTPLQQPLFRLPLQAVEHGISSRPMVFHTMSCPMSYRGHGNLSQSDRLHHRGLLYPPGQWDRNGHAFRSFHYSGSCRLSFPALPHTLAAAGSFSWDLPGHGDRSCGETRRSLLAKHPHPRFVQEERVVPLVRMYLHLLQKVFSDRGFALQSGIGHHTSLGTAITTF